MSTPRTMRPWLRVTNGAALVNGIRAGCYFYLGTGPRDRPKHRRFIENMTLGALLWQMRNGRLWLARKIEKQEASRG